MRHEWKDPTTGAACCILAGGHDPAWGVVEITVSEESPGGLLPLACEVLRLSEEVERLTGELRTMADADPGSFAADWHQQRAEILRLKNQARVAAGAERARIREELLAEIGRLTVYVKWDGQKSAAVDDPYLSAADLLEEVKRICPE